MFFFLNGTENSFLSLPASKNCENLPKNDLYADITTANIETRSSNWSYSSLTTHKLYILCISLNIWLKLLNLSLRTGFATFPWRGFKPSWFRQPSSLFHVSLVILSILPQIRQPLLAPRVTHHRVDLYWPFDLLQDVASIVHHEDIAQCNIFVQLDFPF